MRYDAQSGLWVLQFQDKNDLAFKQPYDYSFKTVTNIPIIYAGRYSYTFDPDGIPSFASQDGTRGPVGGWICWPGKKKTRTAAQWAQVFPAKITAITPNILAVPILDVLLKSPSVDDSMDTLQVVTIDGIDVAVGDLGLVVSGTDLGGQRALFFKGSGGGAFRLCTVTANLGNGSYTVQEVDSPNGVNIGAPFTATEWNGSTVINNNQIVEVRTSRNGTVGFFYPIESC